jgi:hypothetical protein
MLQILDCSNMSDNLHYLIRRRVFLIVNCLFKFKTTKIVYLSYAGLYEITNNHT